MNRFEILSLCVSVSVLGHNFQMRWNFNPPNKVAATGLSPPHVYSETGETDRQSGGRAGGWGRELGGPERRMPHTQTVRKWKIVTVTKGASAVCKHARRRRLEGKLLEIDSCHVLSLAKIK